MTGNELGRYAQALFAADALARGLYVFCPIADYPAVDTVVQSKRRVYRVQVKAVRRSKQEVKHHLRGYRINFNKQRAPGRPRQKTYPPRSYDILAVWLHDESTWAFLTEKSIRGRQVISITPGRGRGAQTNNWWLLR
jgi:hypothetical protein